MRRADLNPTRGNEPARVRPVLVLSQDVFNERSGTVIAAALTSQPQRAGFPLSLELTAARGPKRSWVKFAPRSGREAAAPRVSGARSPGPGRRSR